MDRFGLLTSETSGDDQVLETDIMRFLAVIGIVFWIIFSVIKSIPFQAEPPVSSAAVQTRAQKPQETVKPEKPKDKPPAPETPEPEAEPAPKQAKKKAPTPEKPEKKTEKQAQAPAVKGIKLEFQSLDAIMRLIQNDRLRVYGQAKATGFDLIFLGEPTGQTVRFKNAREIPREMWEIKDGEAREYFIDLMAKTFPSIRTFPDKQVQVAFLDKELEQRVMQKMERLRETDKNGVLSVTEKGALVFNET